VDIGDPRVAEGSGRRPASASDRPDSRLRANSPEALHERADGGRRCHADLPCPSETSPSPAQGEEERIEFGFGTRLDPEALDHSRLRRECAAATPGTGHSVNGAEGERLPQRLRKRLATRAEARLWNRGGAERRNSHPEAANESQAATMVPRVFRADLPGITRRASAARPPW